MWTKCRTGWSLLRSGSFCTPSSDTGYSKKFKTESVTSKR